MDLILRPSTLVFGKPWILQLRSHGPAETEYFDIVRVSDELAVAIVDAGKPFFLFSDPRKVGP